MGDEPNPMKPASPEQAVFAEALKHVPPEARKAYLDGACGTDTNLRRRVESLLRAAENAGDFLEQPPTGLIGDGSAMAVAGLSEQPGDRIGRYKLLQQIGEGGCGVVYMAEQEEPVRRRVALKVIKLGMDTKSVIARFEAERQALALMEHPNIAKVLDAGATETGRPYFVMELVRGIRITDYCNENSLSTGDRLKLFVQVCQAIQHAHQKGVIHRDIKPSNVLVADHDGKPVPKVIDFGIAKATTDQRLTDKTLFTAFEQFIGTPAYMSPEQAKLSGLDIDTRSDIYSLGVLLYELLTGKTPFDGDELQRSGLDEMRRIIRETEPPRPSTRLTSLLATSVTRPGAKSESRTSKSETAGTTSRRLAPTKELINDVRGDLDWIVMKCLEKDRARRYATANGLAADIQRHLDHEPVAARAPSRMYQLTKLTQRNRGALATIAVVLVALLVAVLTLATSNARIRQERNLKDQALHEKGTALEAARASEQQARDQLFVSLENQAQARRNSHQIGQRLESLAVLAEAARLHPATELRDNAIAAMTLPDIELGPTLHDWNPDAYGYTYDFLNQRYAGIGQDSISIRAIGDDRELQRLEFLRGAAVDQFKFNPDGQFLALLDQRGMLTVWQCGNREVMLQDSSGKCSALAFSADSRWVAVGRDDWIVCFDLRTGAEIRRWQARDLIHSMDFSPDGRYLAAGYQETNAVSIYRTDNGQLDEDLQLGNSSNTIVAWHPGGELIAAGGSDPCIQIWNVKERRKVAVLEGHAQQVYFLAFRPGDDLLLSSSWDGTVRLWQPSPGRLLMRLPLAGWTGFSNDGRWAGVVAAPNQPAQLWGVVPSREYFTFVNTFGEGENFFYEGDISPDGRLLAIGGTGGVRLWEVASGREIASLPMASTTTAMFRANGSELLTCGPSGGLMRWPIRATPEMQSNLQVGPPQSIAFSFPPMRICKAENDQKVAVVGESTGQSVVLNLSAEPSPGPAMEHTAATFIALSSDAKRLASSGWHSDRVKVWDAPSGKLIKDLEVGLTSRVFFTPDDREMIVSRSKEFIFYDLKSLEVTRRMPRQTGLHPGYIAFTTDGKMMALEMAPGVIHLKEVNSGRTVAKLEDPNLDLSTWMGFTPDGTQLVVVARYAGAIHRWDLRMIRERLKTMNLDWDWPEFPAAKLADVSFSKNDRPLHVEVLGASPVAAASVPAPDIVPAKP